MNTTIEKRHDYNFFDKLTSETKYLFESYGNEIEVKKGSFIFHESEKPEHIYLLKSGKVRLSKTSVEGKVFFLQMKNSHELLGELSLFNGLNYHFNAEVIHDSVLLRYNRLEIEQLLMRNSELSVNFMKWLSNENHTLLAQFRDLIFCGKEGAVHSILIRLCNEYGMDVSTGTLINKKITNQELANYVGATRESINRILKRLINENVISVNTKYITIHNKEYLKKQLRCNYCPFKECTI
ncbi:Crp/Fnr family transcriptional regulator [Evansella sp. AB-P1]|uniref:Crp/Fnr family transcriptional regulator n=1 Tax=Evansella sp. AB-P1 TaxID=3037653 RepID=UPI00241ECA14|nr:Crp/Fnr family transcriptional regulator [Evansella sp. AB-P1]MDG5789218.1 Crp/Fnr family transcriptional regulator [Evansella sp. AB-P1]